MFAQLTFEEVLPELCAAYGNGKETPEADKISEDVEGDDEPSESAEEIDEKKS